jgi:hypothetical protein
MCEVIVRSRSALISSSTRPGRRCGAPTRQAHPQLGNYMSNILGNYASGNLKLEFHQPRRYSIDDRKSHNRPTRIGQRHRVYRTAPADTVLTCALVPLDPCNGSKSQHTNKIVTGARPTETTISAKLSHDSTRSISSGQQGPALPRTPTSPDLASSDRRQMEPDPNTWTASRPAAAAVFSAVPDVQIFEFYL